MPAPKQTIYVSVMLLFALMTSVFNVASANNHEIAAYRDGKMAALKMEAQVLNCRDYNEAVIASQKLHAWKHAMEETEKPAMEMTHHCCSVLSVLTFPATMIISESLSRTHTLAPVNDEVVQIASAYSDTIYRPPIV